jgi:hypothetical protein
MPYTKMLSVEGATTINNKVLFGYKPLAELQPMITEIKNVLNKNGIEGGYSLLGGACLGGELPVPAEYMLERPTSNLIELIVERWRIKAASEALVENGWQPENPMKYFAIEYTFNGKKNHICTVADEEMFCKNGTSVALVPSPTWRYIVIGNELRRGELKGLETPDKILMRKLFRSTPKDEKDIVSVALVTYLDPLFHSENAIGIFRKYVTNHGFNHVTKSVKKVINALQKTEDASSPLVKHNIDVLNQLVKKEANPRPAPFTVDSGREHLETALITIQRSSPSSNSETPIPL